MSRQPEQNNGPYDSEYREMTEDIASRKFWLRIKGMFISGLFAAGAIALMVFAPQIGLGPMGQFLIPGALAAGSIITSIFTMKEAKELEMREDYAYNYSQGHNAGRGNWRNLRTEVLDYGYPMPGYGYAPPQGYGPPPQGRPRGRY